MNLEKTTWEDPILNVQVFAPQEYCANCWYLDPQDMYTVLYEDGRGWLNNPNGYYSNGEQWDIETTRTRFPTTGYYSENDNQPERLDTQYTFYTSYNTRTYQYNSGKASPVYKWDVRTGIFSTRTYMYSAIRESGHS